MFRWRQQQNAKGCHYGPIFHEKGNATKHRGKLAERKKLPSQMFREINMENTALWNIWQGFGSLRGKKNVVLLLFPSLWPLPQILPGRAGAHLTPTPQCDSGADPLVAKCSFNLMLGRLLIFRIQRLYWVSLVTPVSWFAVTSQETLHKLQTASLPFCR